MADGSTDNAAHGSTDSAAHGNTDSAAHGNTDIISGDESRGSSSSSAQSRRSA
jgi:hypothetical protein